MGAGSKMILIYKSISWRLFMIISSYYIINKIKDNKTKWVFLNIWNLFWYYIFDLSWSLI